MTTTSRRKLLVILGLLLMLWIISYLFPELTIRRHMLARVNPISSFKADIVNMHKYDANHGHLYDVSGFTERRTGDEIGVFYLKKHGPFWLVSSTGTGP